MKVEVRLFATFREGREKKYIFELTENSKVSDIIYILKIKEKEIGILLVNGRDADVRRELYDSDVVAIFPPVGGG